MQKKNNDKLKNKEVVLNTAKKERVICRSYAFTKDDLKKIEVIKDKCLNKKMVLIEACKKVPTMMKGRPKGRKLTSIKK